MVNSVLANGARLYVDHAHPEYSAPESYDPLEAALYDKAGERVMHAAAGRRKQLRRETGLALQEQLRRQGQLLRGP